MRCRGVWFAHLKSSRTSQGTGWTGTAAIALRPMGRRDHDIKWNICPKQKRSATDDQNESYLCGISLNRVPRISAARRTDDALARRFSPRASPGCRGVARNAPLYLGPLQAD